MDTDFFTEGMMKGPDGSLLRFFYDSEKNEVASDKSGRAIFDTVLRVDVITPGQKSSTPRFEIERVFSDMTREVTGINVPYKRSYKYAELEEYVERFRRQEEQHDLGGTPLKMWPRIDRGLQATLFAANIFTVEALAEVSDTNLAYIGMGARDLREQAKAWLALAADGAETSALVAEVADLKETNARLQADLERINASMEALKTQHAAAASNTKMADII